MSTQPTTDHRTTSEPTAGALPTATEADALMTFTAKGLDALDALAEALTHRMAHTPEGIAYVLEHVLHAPLTDLCQALDVMAHELAQHQG